MAMTFYEVPYAENVVCTGRSAQVFPNTSTGSLSGTASYQFQNTSGQEQNVAFGINPGYTISNVQVNGADIPFSVKRVPEYNEAMLEVTIPADEQAELVMEYSGFRRRAAICPRCRAAKRSAQNTCVWRTRLIFPAPDECYAGRKWIPCHH